MNDIKHTLWLIKQIVVLFLKGDINGSIEAYDLLKLHLSYNHKEMNRKGKLL